MSPIFLYEKVRIHLKHTKSTNLIVFLDFDGVINADFHTSTNTVEPLPSGNYNIASPACVKRVNAICQKFDVQIVLSTSWRFSGMDNCIAYLKEVGFTETERIIGMTTLHPEVYNRELEILNWLVEHDDYKGFLILDDAPIHYLSSYQCQSDFEEGFNDSLYQRAVEILSSFSNESVVQ